MENRREKGDPCLPTLLALPQPTNDLLAAPNPPVSLLHYALHSYHVNSSRPTLLFFSFIQLVDKEDSAKRLHRFDTENTNTISIVYTTLNALTWTRLRAICSMFDTSPVDWKDTDNGSRCSRGRSVSFGKACTLRVYLVH